MFKSRFDKLFNEIIKEAITINPDTNFDSKTFSVNNKITDDNQTEYDIHLNTKKSSQNNSINDISQQEFIKNTINKLEQLSPGTMENGYVYTLNPDIHVYFAKKMNYIAVQRYLLYTASRRSNVFSES